MHITEGIITGVPAIATAAVSAGIVGLGAHRMSQFVRENPQNKPLLGMAGAFIFFISLIPIPAFTGTCSHPCGTPLAGILLGPGIGTALAALSLLLQAAFFSHGGFSTWGVNVLALGVAGAGCGWLAFTLAQRLRLPIWVSGALGGLFGDLATYAVSGAILAWAVAHGPEARYTFQQYLSLIYGAYLPTQGPIALGEMVLTGMALHFIYAQRPEVLESLRVVARRVLVSAATVLVLAMVFTCTRPAVAAPIGMDEAVNEHIAEDAGLPLRAPYLDTEQFGDVWNTLLLLAGGTVGFVLGRNWHLLFGHKAVPTPVPLTSKE